MLDTEPASMLLDVLRMSVLPLSGTSRNSSVKSTAQCRELPANLLSRFYTSALRIAPPARRIKTGQRQRPDIDSHACCALRSAAIAPAAYPK
jgi:hypothetical protein